MSRGNDVTTVLALNRISALFGIFFWNAKYATYSLGKCLLLCKVSQTSVEEEFRDILEFLLKGYKLCMHWRLGLMQTNFLLFGCFRKGFITRSFLKWPLYTLEAVCSKNDETSVLRSLLISCNSAQLCTLSSIKSPTQPLFVSNN